MPAALELSALLWPHKIGTEKVILNGALLARKGVKIKPGVSLDGIPFRRCCPRLISRAGHRCTHLQAHENMARPTMRDSNAWQARLWRTFQVPRKSRWRSVETDSWPTTILHNWPDSQFPPSYSQELRKKFDRVVILTPNDRLINFEFRNLLLEIVYYKRAPKL